MNLPYVLFAIYALLVPLPRVLAIPVGNTFIQLADLVYVPLAASVAFGLLTRRLPWPPRAALAGAGAFLAACAISLIGSPGPRVGVMKLAASGYLISIALLVYVLASPSRETLRRVLAPVALSAAITGIAGLLGVVAFYLGFRVGNPALTTWGAIPSGNYPRIGVAFFIPNSLCNFLIVGAAAIFAHAALGAPRERLRAVLLLVPVVIAALFSLSSGFGGMALAVGLGSLVFARQAGRRPGFLGWTAVAGGAVVAAVFVVATVFLIVPRGTGEVPLGLADLSFRPAPRVDIWRHALETIAEHPLTGRGHGLPTALTTDKRAFNPTNKLGTPLELKGPVWLEAHNAWLSVLAQDGLLGFAAFLFLLWALLRPGASPTAARSYLLLGVLGALVYHGCFAAVEDSRHIWVLLGLVAASRKTS